MSNALTVDSAGRIVLPSPVRRLLNLQPGSRLLMTVVAQRIELTPAPEDSAVTVLSSTGRRVLPPTGKVSDAAATVRAERDAQALPRRRR